MECMLGKTMILILLWTVWCFLHSALISEKATRFFRRRLGSRYRYFRLCYNGFALVSLLPVLVYSRIVCCQIPGGSTVFSWVGGWLPVWMLLWGIAVFLWIRARHIQWVMIFENLVLSAYFIIGMILEERKLIRIYGEPYKAYCRQVSALVPFKWAARRVRQIFS